SRVQGVVPYTTGGALRVGQKEASSPAGQTKCRSAASYRGGFRGASRPDGGRNGPGIHDRDLWCCTAFFENGRGSVPGPRARRPICRAEVSTHEAPFSPSSVRRQLASQGPG